MNCADFTKVVTRPAQPARIPAPRSLFAHGESFDPDAFLAATTLRFDAVWHKGDKGRGHPTSNGVKKVLGDGMTIPLYEQERIAIDYLVANRDALRALAQFPAVTTFILGLQHHIVLDESTVGFCVGPSAELMSSRARHRCRADVLRYARPRDPWEGEAAAVPAARRRAGTGRPASLATKT